MKFHHSTMASTSNLHNLFLISSLLLCLLSTTSTAALFRPKALVLSLSKDDSTSQHIIKINQRTPPVSIPVTIDLQGKFLWVDCDRGYKSSTYHTVKCGSLQCSLANSPYKPTCTKNTCNISIKSPFNKQMPAMGKLSSDVVRANSTDGSNRGRLVSVPNFVFGCGHTSTLQGLVKGVKGIAGLGRTKVSLPGQFSSAFHFGNKFALCMSSSSFTDGFIIFGDKPYNLFPGLDASTLLSYTPLILNHLSPSDYYIGVTAIKIFQKGVQVNKSLLSINNKGIGGTKISTVKPYTVMQSSIYKAVTAAFVNQLEGSPSSFAKRVPAVAPFTVCYDSSSLPFTKIGVFVPDINLVMQSENVVWTMSGQNSMVSVNNNAMCLALVDGGENAKAAIVIGAYQLENNLLQFDLVKSRLGFSSSLLVSRTRCDNFNFTAV